MLESMFVKRRFDVKNILSKRIEGPIVRVLYRKEYLERKRLNSEVFGWMTNTVEEVLSDTSAN